MLVGYYVCPSPSFAGWLLDFSSALIVIVYDTQTIVLEQSLRNLIHGFSVLVSSFLGHG